MDPQNNGQSPALVGEVVRNLSLPSGGDVVLRDPGELRAKDKKAVVRNISDDTSSVARLLDVREGTIAMLVEKWTIPYLPNAPLPRDMPSILGELKIPDYDRLLDATAPAVEVLFPTVTADDAAKPGSPTVPASD